MLKFTDDPVVSAFNSTNTPAVQGIIYAVADNGDLLWYRHDGRDDGTSGGRSMKKVGNQWHFKQLFSGGNGVIYAVAAPPCKSNK